MDNLETQNLEAQDVDTTKGAESGADQAVETISKAEYEKKIQSETDKVRRSYSDQIKQLQTQLADLQKKAMTKEQRAAQEQAEKEAEYNRMKEELEYRDMLSDVEKYIATYKGDKSLRGLFEKTSEEFSLEDKVKGVCELVNNLVAEGIKNSIPSTTPGVGNTNESTSMDDIFKKNKSTK